MRCPERIPGVPVASQEEALSTGKARGTPVSCHHSKSPPDVSVHFRGTCFPALPRLSRRGSTHTTVARGTALWECLLGKPRGKAWRENHRSLHTLDGAGVQPRWIQGILRVDGVGMVRLLYLLI